MINDDIETIVNAEGNRTSQGMEEKNRRERKEGNHKNIPFRNPGGKIIGRISENAFCRKVKKSQHLFRKWNAWGIDKAVVESLVRDEIPRILIHDKEEKIDYEVSVKDFAEKGIEGEFGHGEQIFLPLENFEKHNKD